MTTTETANIIVVDDQPANLKLLEEMLKVGGYKIRSFPRGRMALAAASPRILQICFCSISTCRK